MSVFFTSDLHLGHKYAAQQRGFSSVLEHDEAVIESLERVLNKRTLLWVLGDIAWDDAYLMQLCALPGTLRAVLGNHDQLDTQCYLKVFKSVHGFVKYKNLWLSHCPVHPQELWRRDANVHGHIHKGAATPELAFPYINVNWDFWHRAVHLEEIRYIVNDNT